MKHFSPSSRASLITTAAQQARWIAGLVVGGTLAGTQAAHAIDWVGPGTDWNDPANWGGSLPVGTFARIMVTSPTCTISSDFTGNPSFIMVGFSGGNGRLDHVAGVASTGGSQDLQLGRNGAQGDYNLADTSGVGGALTGFAQGSGDMTVERHLYVGGFTSGGGSGTANVNTSGTLDIGGQLLVGNSGGSGTVNVDAGTVTVADAVEFGNGASTTGTFNFGGGTVEKTGGGTAFTIGGGLSAPGGTGVANLSGGTLDCAGTLRVGQGNGSSGTLNLSGAEVIVDGELWVGNQTGATGELNFTAGSLTTNSWGLVGRKDDANTGAGAVGTVSMSGGTWTKTGESNLIVGDTGDGTMDMTGGLVEVVPHPTVERGITWVGNRNDCTGQLSISGSAEWRSEAFTVGVEGGAVGMLDLDGGTVRTSRIVGGAGTSTVNFNGSQIIASGDQAEFMAFLTTANVADGDLRVDTNGFELTATQVLSGTGDVVKSGEGVLRLTGANTYSGDNIVNGGTLLVSVGSTGGGDFVVADGAGMGVFQGDGTSTLSVPNLTLGSTGGASVLIDLGDAFGNPVAAPLEVTGNLTLNGPVAVDIEDLEPEVGSFTLISYSGPKSGSGSFELGRLPNGVSATLSDDGAGTVTLEITDITFPSWTGNVDGVWDTTIENWEDLLTFTPITYTDPAPVVFGDFGFETAVTLDITVAPADVLFENGSLDYSLTGSGKITGSTGLRKTGGGALEIATQNDFTGEVVLGGGEVSIASMSNAGSPSPLGAGSSPVVLSGSVLNFTGATGATDRGLAINAGSALVTTEGELSFGGPVTCDNGSLVKEGTGNLRFSHDGENFLGVVGNGVLVHDGTLTLENGSFDVSGEMWVADLPDRPADLVLQDAELTTASWLAIGRGNGDEGVTNLTATGSTINTVNYSTGFNNGLADNDSEAFVTLTDTVWNNNGVTFLAESNGSVATMTLDGASEYNVSNDLLVARFTGTEATLSLAGTSSVTKTGGYCSIGTEGSGTLSLQDSSSFSAPTGDFNVADVGTSKGVLNLSGSATVEVANAFFAKGTSTTATLNQTGGSFNSTSFIEIGATSGGVAVAHVSGGSMTAATVLYISDDGNGTLNLSGSGSVVANGDAAYVGDGSGAQGTLNLNGGTLTARRLTEGPNGGFSTVRFNGGVLKALGGAGNPFVGNLDQAIVDPGGAIIDSSGQVLTISQVLTGTGGLTKQGAGSLTLTGANTFTGNTTVSQGTLSVNSAFFGDSSTVNIASGAVLNLAHGQTDQVASLIVAGASLPAGTYDAVTHPGIITGTGKLQVSGALSPYDAWAQGFGLDPASDGAPGADPDGDGQTNKVEFALGGDPTDPANNAKVYVLAEDSGLDPDAMPELLMTVAVRAGAPAFSGSPSPSATVDGCTVTIQGSELLSTFAAPVSVVAGPVAPGEAPTPPSGYVYRTFSLDGSNGLSSVGFLRADVTP